MISANLLCILISLPYITTLSCYRCIAEQYASPSPTIYYNTFDQEEVNTSCLQTGAECDADSEDTVKCVTLTIDEGYEDNALSMKIYDCVVGEDDPCEMYGFEQGCSLDICEEENCNSPPTLSCPTCDIDFSEFCGEAAQCPEQLCTDGTGLCFTRFEPASCTVRSGCLESDQTCSGESCETTSNSGEDSDAESSKKLRLCSKECDSISCPSCTVKIKTGVNLTTADLLGCEEQETCEDGVKKCTVIVDANCSSALVGCGTPAENNLDQSETITTEDTITLEIIQGKLSDSDICNGSIVDKCCCFILLLSTLIVANA